MDIYSVVKSLRDHFAFDVVMLRDKGEVREVCSCTERANAMIIAKLLNIFDEQIQEEIGKRK